MKNNGPIFAVLAVVGLLVIVGILFGIGSVNSRLDNSILGTRGLQTWLAESGVNTATAHRRQSIKEEDVLLRILPLFDADLTQVRTNPETRELRNAQESLDDIDEWVVNEKLTAIDTLIMMPKWRNGAITLGLLDEPLLVDSRSVERVLDQIGYGQLQITRPDIKLLEDSGLTLYYPQLLVPTSLPTNCKSALSLTGGVLIAKCQMYQGRSVHILSDPDFMNNHGLSLGENVMLASDQIADITRGQDGLIYFDTSSQMLLRTSWDREPEEIPERSWDDLSRLFTYPFNIIFMSIGLLFALAFWRGLIRFGPAATDEARGVAASKSAAVDAKAYLLRLVGQDAAMTREYTDQKLWDLSHAIFGKKTERSDLLNRLSKLSPADAAELNRVVADIDSTGPETSPQQLIHQADAFETIYRRLLDEFGHLSRRR